MKLKKKGELIDFWKFNINLWPFWEAIAHVIFYMRQSIQKILIGPFFNTLSHILHPNILYLPNFCLFHVIGLFLERNQWFEMG